MRHKKEGSVNSGKRRTDRKKKTRGRNHRNMQPDMANGQEDIIVTEMLNELLVESNYGTEPAETGASLTTSSGLMDGLESLALARIRRWRPRPLRLERGANQRQRTENLSRRLIFRSFVQREEAPKNQGEANAHGHQGARPLPLVAREGPTSSVKRV